MLRNKIGFILNFIDFRNDIREIILRISNKKSVVIFVKKKNLKLTNELFKENLNIEIREFHENELILNNIYKKIFNWFGIIAKSKKNFFLMKYFLIINEKFFLKKLKNIILFNISRFFPRFISYDTFLNLINSHYNEIVADIGEFFFITKVESDEFLSYLIKKKFKVTSYVYSWDHPAKHNSFSKRINYLVWNDWIKDDLTYLQNIKKEKIKIIGSTQFCYIYDYIKNYNTQKPIINYDYLYFGCAVGIPQIAKQEVEIIINLSKIIKKNNINLKILVRPYPVLENWSIYEKLNFYDNIVVEKDFRNINLSIKKDKILEKYNKIKFAAGFLHLGTTLGIEACFFDSPSIIIDFGYNFNNDFMNIKNTIHQYQNYKYVIKNNFNYFDNEKKFLNFIMSNNKKKYLDFNLKTRKSFNLKSFDKIAEEFNF